MSDTANLGRPKTLAYDLRTNHRTGIFRYARSILARLAPMVADQGARLAVLHSYTGDEPDYEALRAEVSGDGVRFVRIPDDSGFTRTSPWLREWLAQERVDLYYTAGYVVDPDIPTPYIHTIHDLMRLKQPWYSFTDASFQEQYGEREFRQIRATLERHQEYVPAGIRPQMAHETFLPYFWAINRFQAVRCRKMVTVSETSAQDIVDLLGAPREKVVVAPAAVEPRRFYPRDGQKVAAVRERLGVPPNYCLNAGLAHAHKRLPWLLEAWASAIEQAPSDAALVLVVADAKARAGLENLIRKQGLEERTLLLDYVTDEELACLYSGARALVMASSYEGFCMMAHEALLCGAEVVTPGLPAVRETIGEAGHYFGRDDAAGLTGLLIDTFRGRLTAKAPGFHSRYCWEKSASRLMQAITEVW